MSKGLRALQTAQLSHCIKTALVQARVDHPNICKILAMHLSIRDAPIYYLEHILEGLDTDLEKEMKKRERDHRHFSELEIWNFLRQTMSVLTYLHSKVKAR